LSVYDRNAKHFPFCERPRLKASAAADFSLSAKSGPQIGSPICRFREDCERASGGKRFAQAKRCHFLAAFVLPKQNRALFSLREKMRAKKREAATFPARLASFERLQTSARAATEGCSTDA